MINITILPFKLGLSKKAHFSCRVRDTGKLWQKTEMTVRLMVSYFNWIWQHSHLKTTAAQWAGLSEQPWIWHDAR